MVNSYILASPNNNTYTTVQPSEYTASDKSLVFTITTIYDLDNILYTGRVYAPIWRINTSEIIKSVHPSAPFASTTFGIVGSTPFNLNGSYGVYMIRLYRGTISDNNLISFITIAYATNRQLPYYDEVTGTNLWSIYPVIKSTIVNTTVSNAWHKSGTLFRRITGQVTASNLRVTYYDAEGTSLLTRTTSIPQSSLIMGYTPGYVIKDTTTSEQTFISSDFRLSSGYAMYVWATMPVPRTDISAVSYAAFDLIIDYVDNSTQTTGTSTIALGAVDIGVFPNEERNDTYLLQWYDSNGQYCSLPCEGANRWKSNVNKSSYQKNKFEMCNYAGDVTYELTLNTGWISEDLNKYIEGIYNSRNVWIAHCSIFTNDSTQSIRPLEYNTTYGSTSGKYPDYTGVIKNLNDAVSEAFACTVKGGYQEKTRREDRQLVNYTLNLTLNKKQFMI